MPLCYTYAALQLLRVATDIAPEMTDDEKDEVSRQAQIRAANENRDEVETFHVVEAWRALGHRETYGKLIYWG